MESTEVERQRQLEDLGHSFGINSGDDVRCTKCGSSKGFAVAKSVKCQFKGISTDVLARRFVDELGHRMSGPTADRCNKCGSSFGNALSWGVVCRFKGATDAEIERQKAEAEQQRRQAAWVSLKQELKDDLVKAPGALAEIVLESLAASAKVVGAVRKFFPWLKS